MSEKKSEKISGKMSEYKKSEKCLSKKVWKKSE